MTKPIIENNCEGERIDDLDSQGSMCDLVVSVDISGQEEVLKMIGEITHEILETQMHDLENFLSSKLSKESIFNSLLKLLTLTNTPSVGLKLGLQLGVFNEIFPEFLALKNTPQDPEWHPEGDVWEHTMMCVDAAAMIVRRDNLDEQSALVVLFGALCHDFGKPYTTDIVEGRIRAFKHDILAGEYVHAFLERLGVSELIREKVVRITLNHMLPVSFFELKDILTDGAIRRLAKRLFPATIEELARVSETDYLGRGPFFDESGNEYYPTDYKYGKWLIDKANELNVYKEKISNLLTGKDLIELGFVPGKTFGLIIELANKLKTSKGLTREQVLLELESCDTELDAKDKLEQLLNSGDL